jgi:hypothetical protein
MLENTTNSTLKAKNYQKVHPSEFRWIDTNDKFDFILYNDDTIETLYSKVSDELST